LNTSLLNGLDELVKFDLSVAVKVEELEVLVKDSFFALERGALLSELVLELFFKGGSGIC